MVSYRVHPFLPLAQVLGALCLAWMPLTETTKRQALADLHSFSLYVLAWDERNAMEWGLAIRSDMDELTSLLLALRDRGLDSELTPMSITTSRS